MKAKIVAVVATVLVVGLGASPALAKYSSVFHNQWNGVGDTDFRPDLPGKPLTVSETVASLPQITLSADEIAPGSYTTRNATCYLETYFQSYDPTYQDGWPYGRALFLGGSFSLTFEYSTDQVNWTSHNIGGPIAGMYLGVSEYIPGAYTKFKGEGLFDSTEYLPPPPEPGGLWDDGGGQSSIHGLTIKIGGDYTGYGFQTPVIDAETQYTLTPDETAAPEPTALVLLAIGAMALVRRRR